jgi:hypothetical protein
VFRDTPQACAAYFQPMGSGSQHGSRGLCYLDEIGPRLRERWGGIFTTLNLPTDFPLRTADDEKRLRGIIEILHRH